MAQVKALIGNIKGKDGESFTNYSKDEQVIGKWVDGKPLYRRYFNFIIKEYVIASKYKRKIKESGYHAMPTLFFFTDTGLSNSACCIYL